jgi:SAM-dependent methyltransferase
MNDDMLEGAGIYASREKLLEGCKHALDDYPHQVAEVGVAYGAFSEAILRVMQPSSFHAFDRFDLHTYPVVFGGDPKAVFGAQTHYRYYNQRFPDAHLWWGDSWYQLTNVDADTFDFAYLDAGHDYDSVSRDIAELDRVVRPGGIIMFDDYTNYDIIAGEPFGVMAAVNEYIESGSVSRVLGLSLHPQGFHNIAVRLAK